MPPSQTIRLARLDEASLLHDLIGRSALHWGYEPEFLDWEPESIAVTPTFLALERPNAVGTFEGGAALASTTPGATTSRNHQPLQWANGDHIR